MARAKKPEISEATYELVIETRDAGNVTKKRLCEMLGIAYNTKRLDTLLEDFEAEKEHRKAMMKKMRTKSISEQDVAGFVEDYLTGESLVEIAKRSYRSPALIRRRLEMAGVWGLRFQETPNPLDPHLVPDECMSETFEVGQKVWVPGYRCLGEVKNIYTNQPDGVDAYRVYLLSERERNVTFKAYNLGSLVHIEKLGVNLASLSNTMAKDDVTITLNETMRAARKTANKDKR